MNDIITQVMSSKQARSHKLLQWFYSFQRLPESGEFPVFEQLNFVQFTPFQHMRQRALREFAVYRTSLDLNRDLKLSVS